jgi:ABC-type multidrug transport system permease subunit
VTLASLDRYAETPSRAERALSALESLGALLAAAFLLAGVSAFLFGVRRTLFDVGLWWRFGLLLACALGLRRLAVGKGRAARLARAVEALLFIAAGALALREAASTLLRLMA